MRRRTAGGAPEYVRIPEELAAEAFDCTLP
jgi:hypothetical protein